VLIVALNVKFHLFQEPINQYTAVIVSDKTNHKIQEVIDIPEMIEVQDIPETIEVQDLHLDENLVEIILDLASHEVINF
jgi:hypothetical protein